MKTFLYQPLFFSKYDKNLPAIKVFDSEDEARKWGKSEVDKLKKEHETNDWGMAISKVELVSP